MKIIISMPARDHERLTQHLLPPGQEVEESAFVFAAVSERNGEVKFSFIESLIATSADYAFQSDYHIELTDDFKQCLLKRANKLKAMIIEFHSHTGGRAMFSPSDLDGFTEFVPHVLWRTSQKWYAAVVVTPMGFDALAWKADELSPVGIEGLSLSGQQTLYPTNLSLSKLMADAKK